MSNSEATLNRIFVNLEAAYIKKAKYVKIINTMKHSNIPYWKSIQMDHPIYSLKQAEYEVKRWENNYHGQIVKHINNFTIMKPENNKMISLHSLTRKDLIDLVANNLKKVQQARRHLQYVQNIYKDYKTRLENINEHIKELKQEIIATIIYKDIDVGEKTTGSTNREIEGLAQAIDYTYRALKSDNAPTIVRANPEDCKMVLFNGNPETHTTAQDSTNITEKPKPKPKPKTHTTGIEIGEAGSEFAVDMDGGPTSTEGGFIFDPNTGGTTYL